MSVITPRGTSEGDSRVREQLKLDAWALCVEFVEQIVSEAQSAAQRDNPGHEIPGVDWDSIWRAGEGAPSDESALGRVIRAASEAARGIAVGTATVPSPPPVSDRLAEDADAPTDLTHQAAGEDAATPTDDVVALVEPFATPADTVGTTTVEPGVDAPTAVDAVTTSVEPDVTAVEPVTAPVETVPTPLQWEATVVEPVTAPTEPITPPVIETTAQPDSVTVEREVPQAAAFVAPSDTQTMPVTTESLAEVHEAETERVMRRRSASLTAFTWMRNVGALILLFVVWQLWGTSIAQHHAQDQLKAQFDAAVRTHHPPVPVKPGALIPVGTRFAPAADGSVLARLEIPAIGVDQYVVEGTTDDDLSRGPGHYVGTALPGQAGNVAIAGHRTTHGAPFNGLGHLVRGDRIILTTTWGERLTYIVSGTPQAVSPGDVAVLNYFGDNRITLTTCNPEFSSSQRLVAVGELDRRVKTPPAHFAYHVVDPATASWDWSLLPVAGIEICLLLLLALSYRRFDYWFGRASKWLILVPVWAAGLYLLFGTLTTFFPSSI